MFNLQNYLRGQLRLTITAPFPDRLLNLAAQENILFWGLEWHDSTHLSLTIPRDQYALLKKRGEKIGATLVEEHSKGLPTLLQKLRHRLGFLLGFALSLLTVTLLSQFILVIEIRGNDKVDSATILWALEQSGLKAGVYGPSLPLSQLSQAVLSQTPGITWMGIQISGTRAIIEVREATPAPEISPTQGLYDMIATETGIIEEIQVHKGQSLVEVGETVVAGQCLISGHIQLPTPQYSELTPQWLVVPSSAVVIARTWREITALIPLNTMVKEPYGVARNSFALEFFDQRWALFETPAQIPLNYHKEKNSHPLPYLSQLPIAFTHSSESPYRLAQQSLNRNSARQLLEETLLEELATRLAEEGEILSTQFQAVEKDGLLYVTLQAECRENIAMTTSGTLRFQPDPE